MRTIARDQPLFACAGDAVLATGDATLSPEQAGRQLWDLVMGEDVGDWWGTAVDTAGTAPVRTLLDVRVPGLRGVPWELMVPGPGRAPAFRNHELPWVRAHRTPWPPPGEILAPITVLVVVGSTEEGLRVDDEIAAVHGALRGVPGLWNVEVLVEPKDNRCLTAALRDVQPDVLHVVAHGREVGEQLVLGMEGGDGRWALRTEQVDLMPRPMPRLVVLNTCRSGSGRSGQDAGRLFTEAFIARGAAAVIAIQGDITSRAAAAFSETLYTELAEGHAVDVATAAGRDAISNLTRPGAEGARCWAMPSLTVAADPELVLPVRVEADDRRRITSPPYRDAMKDVHTYFDRVGERRTLFRALDPGPDDAPSGLVILSGEPQIGKTAIVLSALMTLRLRGRNIVYVDLTREAGARRGLSWLAALRRIRDAVDEWVPGPTREPVLRFNHDLWFHRRHQDPQPWSPGSAKSDDGEEFPSDAEDFDQHVADIFTSFLRMLTDSAGDRPLLLVLDALHGLYDGDLTRWLTPKLLEPIGLPPERPEAQPLLTCALVGTPRELEPLTPRARQLATEESVGPLKAAELPRLAREFFARQGIPVAETTWWPKLHALIAGVQQPVPPGALLLQLKLASTLYSGGAG